MTVSAQVPTDHPLMLAWATFKATDEYANSKKWAVQPADLDGSLWAMFAAGFVAASTKMQEPATLPPLPEPEALAVWALTKPTSFTAEQMRAYALDALVAQQPKEPTA